jgi:hypothetical protein
MNFDNPSDHDTAAIFGSLLGLYSNSYVFLSMVVIIPSSFVGSSGYNTYTSQRLGANITILPTRLNHTYMHMSANPSITNFPTKAAVK